MGDLAETFRSPKELLSRLVLCGEAGGEREARGARRCASGEAGPSAGVSCRAATARGESRGEGPRDAGFPGALPPRALAGPGTSRDSGLGSCARAALRRTLGTHGAVGALPGWGPACPPPPRPALSLVGMCLLSSLQLLPNPTGESPESEQPGTGVPRAPGARGTGNRRTERAGARARGAGTEAEVPRASGRPEPGRRGRRRRVLGGSRHWDLRIWGGEGTQRATWRRALRVMSGHLQVHFHSSLQPPPGSYVW